MKTIKNISGTDLAIVGVGLVKADETVDVSDDFSNANFTEVRSTETPKSKQSKKVQTEDETV